MTARVYAVLTGCCKIEVLNFLAEVVLPLAAPDFCVHGGFAAVNRGADCVQPLVPALRARTRYWTGHRELYNQAALACTAPGAGQHRD